MSIFGQGMQPTAANSGTSALAIDFIIIILLQECAFFYFWSPAEVPRMQGSAGFCSLVVIFHDLEHPTFANLWQSCHILVLLSTSFSVFLFSSHQLLRVVPLLDPFLHPISPHVPTIATFSLSETLPISLHSSVHESSHCSFYLSRFSHISFATFSFLWSWASFDLPLSMPNIRPDLAIILESDIV